jgi:hypothetical protein
VKRQPTLCTRPVFHNNVVGAIVMVQFAGSNHPSAPDLVTAERRFADGYCPLGRAQRLYDGVHNGSDGSCATTGPMYGTVRTR